MTAASRPAEVRTRVPARIDRLPWSPFHNRLVAGLGVAWVLDGLEVTVASSVSDVLTRPETLALTPATVGLLGAAYLLGQVAGALLFGSLADRWGRRTLFLVTLAVYFGGSGATALTLGGTGGWLVVLFGCRFVAGLGIGGEYVAINSAIDELVPARHRGRVDVMVNGTYWFGAIVGALGTYVFLNVVDLSHGWRIGFAIGPVLAVVIWYVRRGLPESPRWQLVNGREDEAERTVGQIEDRVRAWRTVLPPPAPDAELRLYRPTSKSYGTLLALLVGECRRRTVLAVVLMMAQSYLYNAFVFTFTLVLGRFYHVPAERGPIYLIPFSVASLIGPLLLGPLFDIVGRRTMIAGTYLASGALITATAVLFELGVLTAVTQTAAWCVVFVFASAGASAAYLTASELFPLEVRARAIAVFFAAAQLVGLFGPVVYGDLIGSGSDPFRLFLAHLTCAAVMLIGGVVAVAYGVPAERRSLEDIAHPLSDARRGPATAPDPLVHQQGGFV